MMDTWHGSRTNGISIECTRSEKFDSRFAIIQCAHIGYLIKSPSDTSDPCDISSRRWGDWLVGSMIRFFSRRSRRRSGPGNRNDRLIPLCVLGCFTTCTSKDLKSVSNSVELSVKNVNISSSNEERDITGARTGSGVER